MTLGLLADTLLNKPTLTSEQLERANLKNALNFDLSSKKKQKDK